MLEDGAQPPVSDTRLSIAKRLIVEGEHLPGDRHELKPARRGGRLRFARARSAARLLFLKATHLACSLPRIACARERSWPPP